MSSSTSSTRCKHKMQESYSRRQPCRELPRRSDVHGIFSISGLAKSRMIQEMTMARKNRKL